MMRIAGVVIVVAVCGITSSLLALNDQTGAAIVVWGAGAALVTLWRRLEGGSWSFQP